MSFTEWIADSKSHDEGQHLHSGALRSSGSQAARRQLWRRNTFGSGWNTPGPDFTSLSRTELHSRPLIGLEWTTQEERRLIQTMWAQNRRTESGEGIVTAAHGFTQSEESVCCDSELWNIVLAVETLQPWITAQKKKQKNKTLLGRVVCRCQRF